MTIRMPADADNVIEFPLHRRPTVHGCPQCGAQRDRWQIGRLLWGYCMVHEVRWVAADLQRVDPERLDRAHMRRGLEFLAAFTEVSH